MASTDAKAFPIKNQAYRVTFPILDADGDLVTAAAALDSEVSKDGATFTDCTTEATEIATGSGVYYLDLTATEMNADTVAVIVKTTSSGAKTTTMVFYPLEDADLRVNVAQWAGTATTATLPAVPGDAMNLTTVYNPSKTAAQAGDAMALTTSERTTLSGVIWNVLTSTLTTANTIGKLLVDNINATISSRSTYAGGDTPGTTTLLSRIASALTITSGKVDVNDKTGFSLTAAYDPCKTSMQAGSTVALTSAYDAAKVAAPAGAAMTLTTGERVAVGVAVRDTDNAPSLAGTVGGDIKSGITGDPWNTILPGSYAANTAGKIIGDNVNATISSRLPTASYVTPPTAAQNAAATRDVSNASPAGGSLGADIKSASSAGDPWSTLLPGSYGAGSAGKLMADNLDAKVSTRAQAGQAMTLTSPERDAVAAAVRDVPNATPAVGSLGADVKTSAATGDPWGIAIPGSYAAGTAGKILGDRLDVNVSTRLASSSYVPAPDANTVAVATRDINNQTPAANSLGAAINSAASAGDPWSTQLPGSYANGTAGKIIGTQIDAAVSSRLAAANYTVPPTKEVIAIATRDVDNSSPVSGSMGDKINAGASAGDPWSTVLPGSYGTGTAGKLMSDNLDAKVSTRLPTSSYVASPQTSDIASAVRDVDNRTPAPNSLGAAVNSAASAGDPWTTVLPGSYGANTAGSIIGSQLDATVSSRLAANNYVVPPTIESIAVANRDVNNVAPAANSLGAAVNRAASAGDPWGTQLPGGYGVGTAGKLLSDNLNAAVASRLPTSSYVVPPNVNQIAASTRDVDNTNPMPGSLGAAVNSAASAGDPWATALPGAYAAGTAGAMIGNNMDAKVSTRMPSGSYVAPPSIQSIAEGVRDVDNTNPATNSLGADVKKSAATGDPWAIQVPAAYPAGSAGKLVGDNLDAKVSTRSTYNGTDTPGTTTLLTRVPGPINVSGGGVYVADKTGYSLDPSYDKAKTAAQPGDAMSLTPTERTTLSSAVWQYLTSFLTSAGTIGKLLVDQLNAPIASRLPTSSYVAPDNASITAIKLKTDAIPPNPALVTDVPTVGQIAAGCRDISNATPAAGSVGADIKAGAQVADPWAINVPGTYAVGTAGSVLGTRLDAAVSTRLPTANIALNSGMVTVGTNNDKVGYSLSSPQLSAVADEVLKRDWQAVSGEAAYSVLNALRFLRDAWEVKPDGTLVVYKENGQIAWTRTVNADAEALPITGVQ